MDSLPCSYLIVDVCIHLTPRQVIAEGLQVWIQDCPRYLGTSVDSEQKKLTLHRKQWTVDSEQWTVNKQKLTIHRCRLLLKIQDCSVEVGTSLGGKKC